MLAYFTDLHTLYIKLTHGIHDNFRYIMCLYVNICLLLVTNTKVSSF